MAGQSTTKVTTTTVTTGVSTGLRRSCLDETGTIGSETLENVAVVPIGGYEAA